MQKLLQNVLKKNKPSEIEESKIARLANKLHEVAHNLGYSAVICGSIGKLTWLSGDHDVDLFVLFDKSVSRQDLEKVGLEIGRKMASLLKGRPIVKYAEHPYTRIRMKSNSDYFDVDVVPCYKIMRGERIISAVDRSPLHLSYILKNLRPGQRDDVRLLKQFMKGTGVYGSDAKNLGFSGYLCELLVLGYGRFESVLKAAADWHAPQIIEIEKTSAIRSEASASIGRKRFDEPLIIIDPTDESRNAAAAVSAENFARFITCSKKFIEKPDSRYFFPKEIPMKKQEIRKLKLRGTKFLAIVMKKPDLIDDILYPQVRRAIKRIDGLMRHNEFYTVRNYEFADKKNVVFMFELETWSLPEIKKMIGPVIFSRKHTKEFLSKYQKTDFRPHVEDSRWVIEKKRDFKNISELTKDFIGKKPTELVASGIPKNIAGELHDSRIMEHDTFWKLLGKNKGFSIFLRKKYFDNER